MGWEEYRPTCPEGLFSTTARNKAPSEWSPRGLCSSSATPLVFCIMTCGAWDSAEHRKEGKIIILSHSPARFFNSLESGSCCNHATAAALVEVLNNLHLIVICFLSSITPPVWAISSIWPCFLYFVNTLSLGFQNTMVFWFPPYLDDSFSGSSSSHRLQPLASFRSYSLAFFLF